MGHVHLATLPATRPWAEVVALLSGGASDEDVIAAGAIAAEKDFVRAADSPVLVEAVRLLAMLPQAARAADFGAELRRLGLPARDSPMLSDLILGVEAALDARMRDAGSRDDFGGIVRRAMLGTLNVAVGEQLPGLFSAEPADVRAAVARLGRPTEFPRVARYFFGSIVGDTLSYWLDRTLAAEVGPGRRFPSLSDRSAFEGALLQYCSEATRIIREFSGAWYSKTLYRDGTITGQRAGAFSAVAFRKITEELRRKRQPHA